MKINTITCQHVYNYGATLQAYALQSYLESIGNEVEIIQFIPIYHHRYEFLYVYPTARLYEKIRRNPLLKILYCLKNNRGSLICRGRKFAFDKFDKIFLHLSEKIYENSQSLKDDPPLSDMYIAGSDQIWNTEMQNGHEAAYYLDFGEKK